MRMFGLLLICLASLPAHAGELLPLVEIYTHGGLCPPGAECQDKFIISKDGQTNDGKKLSPSTIKRLTDAIETTNYDAIKSQPFMGECPTAYDGSEVVYTFYPASGKQVIASCSYSFSADTEPFKTLQNIRQCLGGKAASC